MGMRKCGKQLWMVERMMKVSDGDDRRALSTEKARSYDVETTRLRESAAQLISVITCDRKDDG